MKQRADLSEADLVAALSEKQRRTLRLTYLHKTSKEIAKLSDVTPYAIDAQIARAIQKLGVRSRIEAAALVMRHSPGAYEQFVYQPPAIADPGSAPPHGSLSDEPADCGEGELAEMPAAYMPPSQHLPGKPARWNWGNPDDLKPVTRAWLIPVFAFFLLAIVFTLLAMGEQASRWAVRILPQQQSSSR
ncbi:MAG: helix-turn-helix transcriptional regulator [Sphingomonas sp.]